MRQQWCRAKRNGEYGETTGRYQGQLLRTVGKLLYSSTFVNVQVVDTLCSEGRREPGRGMTSHAYIPHHLHHALHDLRHNITLQNSHHVFVKE